MQRPTQTGLSVLAIALLALAAAAGPARAQTDVRTLLDRVDRLERDMSTMQQQVYQGRPPAPGQAPVVGGAEASALGTLQVKVSQLEEEFQKLTGQVEEANYALAQLRSRVERMSSDVDFRLGELEKGKAGGPAPVAAAPGAAAAPAAADAGLQPGPGAPPRNLGSIPAAEANRPGAAGPVASAGSPGTATQPRGQAPAQTAALPSGEGLPPGTAQQQYDYAFDLMTKTDYAGAESAFKQFLAVHKDDKLAANAQYWMAETFYVRGNYNEAAQQFLTGYEKYPKGPKAPDNLMKLGLSLLALNDNQKACAVFARFDKEFPTAGGALKSRVVDAKKRGKCPA